MLRWSPLSLCLAASAALATPPSPPPRAAAESAARRDFEQVLQELYPSSPRKGAPGKRPPVIAQGVPGAAPTWLDQPGSITEDTALDIAVGNGATYTAGFTQGVISPGTSSGLLDAVLISHDLNTGMRRWVRQFGTSALDVATSVATHEPTGFIYVAGHTTGALTPLTPHAGRQDVFLAQYDATGARRWVRQFGTAMDERALGIATDPAGNVVVVGVTQGTLGTTANVGGADLFAAKYSAAGTRLWLYQSGTPQDDEARGVASDASGNLYVVGQTGGGLHGQMSAGASDLFLLKLLPTGVPDWTRQTGTPEPDSAEGVATSRRGIEVDIYVTGYTTGDLAAPSAGGQDIVLLKYDSGGASPWQNQVGTGGDDIAYGITSDGGGSFYLAGVTNYDYVGGTSTGDKDLLLLKFNLEGGFIRSYQTTSVDPANPAFFGEDIAYGVAADRAQGVYLAGLTRGRLPGGSHAGGADMFVLKLGDQGCSFDTPGECGLGYGWGDPHLVTFDRVAYDFQGAGEFTLMKSVDDDFHVQTRHEPWNGSSVVSVFTAAAARVGSDRVAFYLYGSDPVRVNGDPVDVGGGDYPLDGGGLLTASQHGGYEVSWPGGERLRVAFRGSYLDVNLLLPPSRRGAVQGLLGNYNGERQDDFARPDGSQLESPLSFDRLYRDGDSLANSWRVDADTTLFDYEGWDGPETYHLYEFPEAPLTVDEVPAQEREEGERLCRDAGLEHRVFLDACIVDGFATGDWDLARLASFEAQQLDALLGPGTPPEPAGGRSVYFNDFQEEQTDGWDNANLDVTPNGDRLYLGRYMNDEARLHLSDLPDHQRVTVSFDVYVMGGWMGEDGPNLWFLRLWAPWDQELLVTSFSNTGSPQAYPEPSPASHEARTGASEVDTLGHPYGDAVYRVRVTFEHSDSELGLTFGAENLYGWTDETWGLDNVSVQVH